MDNDSSTSVSKGLPKQYEVLDFSTKSLGPGDTLAHLVLSGSEEVLQLQGLVALHHDLVQDGGAASLLRSQVTGHRSQVTGHRSWSWSWSWWCSQSPEVTGHGGVASLLKSQVRAAST